MGSYGIAKLVFVAVMIAISVLGAVYRKYQEQAAKRKARELLERAEMEQLRTGPRAGDGQQQAQVVMMSSAPAAPSTPMSPREQLRELAERRNRQLQELRRRMAQRGGSAAGTPRPPAPPRLMAEAPPPEQPAPARSTPVQGPSRGEIADYEEDRKRELQAKRRAAKERGDTQRAAAAAAPQPKVRRPAQQPDTLAYQQSTDPGVTRVARAAARVVGGQRMTTADWRRMIVMRELFGPPVSMRDPENEETVA